MIPAAGRGCPEGTTERARRASVTSARLHDHFEKRLGEIAQRHPGLIEGPFGIGAMIAFTPLGGNPDKVIAFVHALFEGGVISFYCGSNPTRARFLVPVVAITHEEVDHVLAMVEKTLLHVGGKS